MRIKQDGQDGTDGSCSGDERTGYWDSCAGEYKYNQKYKQKYKYKLQVKE